MTLDDVSKRAEALLGEILRHMGADVRAHARLDGDAVVMEIEGPEVELVIGKQGRTLDALQQILVRSLLREGGAGIALIVDAEGYRARHAETLASMATRSAHDVVESRRPARLANLSASERRIVHAAAGKVAGVRSYSEGEGDGRVLVIEPVES